MSHWGKLIGTALGYVTGGGVGAIVGLIIGYLFDSRFRRYTSPSFTQIDSSQLYTSNAEYFIAVFSVMGYIAQVTGQTGNGVDVSRTNLVVDRLELSEFARTRAVENFNRGASSEFKFSDCILELYQIYQGQPYLLRMFIEIQLFAAYSDGEWATGVREILTTACSLLDISNAELDRLQANVLGEFQASKGKKKSKQARARKLQARLNEAYAILDTSPKASNDEVTRAYRRLTSKHHPDKLVAKGMPEEVLKMAEAKTREIRAAYERIKQVRNL